jgi:RNA polymerase sigma-70 factor, ECF subfamily
MTANDTTLLPPDFEADALRWLPDVMRFALSLTRDRGEAEDLVQDTYLAARQYWHQFTSGSDARAWLFTIARHRHYRVGQRAERQVAVDDAGLESLASAAVEHGRLAASTEELERGELRDAIRRAMHALPPVFREVAVLVDWHDQTYETVAEILGVPIGTVRSRLFRARRLLQEALRAHARDSGLLRSPLSSEAR